MAKTLEFFYDFGSPATYLAHTQMPGLAARSGADVRYRPMLLGGVFKATGNQSPIVIPAKGAYMGGHDLPRFARRYCVPFKLPPGFPINTLALMRGAIVAEEEGSAESYIAAMFRAIWADGENMTEPKVVAGVLTAAGLDAQHFFARIDEQPIKDQLKANTEEAVARGAFGAPTFFVGEEMFFGQDRLDFVEEALTA
jgi:2-hydroxychromene-2-carboxylate isomerase